MVAFSSSFYGLSFLVTISMLYRIALANAFPYPFIRPVKIGTLEIGNKYTLTCTVSGVKEYTLVWSKDSSRIPSSGRIIQTHVESIHNLTFSHLQYDDQGWYECKLEYNATTSISSELQIQFPAYKKKYESNDSPNLLVKMGQDVHLPCEIAHLKDSILSNVHWNYKGTELSLPRSRFNVDDDNQLTIQNVNVSDGGTYKCILSSDREFKLLGPKILLMVVVAQFPLFISLAGNKSAIVLGGFLRLRCIFKFSKSASRIIWQKNNQIIILDDRIIEPKMGILQIKDLQTRDEGHYSCVVENKILEQFISSQSIYIEIGARNTKSFDSYFVYPNHPENRDIRKREGEPLTIECLGFGNHLPYVYWKRLKKTVGWATVNEEDGIRFAGNRNLKFESLNVRHSGLYSCVLNTSTNSLHTKTRKFRLIVSDSPPDMIARLSNTNPKNGGYVRITCEVIQPSQYFVLPYHSVVLKNGEPLSNYNLHSFTTRTSFGVVISSISTDDEGIYQCQVWSPAGYSSTWTTLMVERESVTENYVDPQSMSITLLSTEKAIFEWSSKELVSQHGKNIYFAVHIFNPDRNTYLTKETLQNSIRIPYEPDVCYSIYIRTHINQNGEDKFSDPLPPFIFQVPTKIFFPKVKILYRVISPTLFSVNFSPYTKFPKFVDGYEIQLLDFTETGKVKLHNFTYYVAYPEDDSALETVCTIKNLRQSTTYGFWVKAFNNKSIELNGPRPDNFKWNIFITPKAEGGAHADVGQNAWNRGDEDVDDGPIFTCLLMNSFISNYIRNLEALNKH